MQEGVPQPAHWHAMEHHPKNGKWIPIARGLNHATAARTVARHTEGATTSASGPCSSTLRTSHTARGAVECMQFGAVQLNASER